MIINSVLGKTMGDKFAAGVIYTSAAGVGMAELADWTIQDWAAVGVFGIALLSFIFSLVRFYCPRNEKKREGEE